MAKGRITKRSVDGLVCPPGCDRSFLWDDTLSGFGVAAFPGGKRVYYAQYRQGRSRRIALGEHGRLTPDEARTAAKKILGQVANGQDPIAARKSERGVPTFGELAAEYMASYAKTQVKESTRKAYGAKLRLHLQPAFGGKRITDISVKDLSDAMERWSETPAGANRTLATFSSIWSWAAKTYEHLKLPICPAKNVDKYHEEACERFLKTEELGRLSETLVIAETVGLPYEVDTTKPKAKHAAKPENRLVRIDPYVIAAIRLLVFTGARFAEIVRATWDEVDLARGTLTLTKERSKAKRRSKERFKVIQLSPFAVDILKGLRRVDGNPHIIVGLVPGKPRSDFAKPWRAIRKAANLDGLRIHDLRHSYASIGAGKGLSLHTLGGLLGHNQAQTTARYAHLAADPLRVANDAIGAAIAATMYPLDGARKTDVPSYRTSYGGVGKWGGEELRAAVRFAAS